MGISWNSVDEYVLANLRRTRPLIALVIDTDEGFACRVRDCLGGLSPVIDTSWNDSLGSGLARLAHCEADYIFLGRFRDGGSAVQDGIRLRRASPRARVIVTHDVRDDDGISRLAGVNASSVVPDTLAPERLHAALRWVCAGGVYMPGDCAPEAFPDRIPSRNIREWLQERELARLFFALHLQGLSVFEIAEVCRCGIQSVRMMVPHVRKKLGARSRRDELRVAAREGISIVWPGQ